MERLDANGMTEREFLAAYVEKSYPKPSLTADILIFSRGDGGIPCCSSAAVPTPIWDAGHCREGS